MTGSSLAMNLMSSAMGLASKLASLAIESTKTGLWMKSVGHGLGIHNLAMGLASKTGSSWAMGVLSKMWLGWSVSLAHLGSDLIWNFASIKS